MHWCLPLLLSASFYITTEATNIKHLRSLFPSVDPRWESPLDKRALTESSLSKENSVHHDPEPLSRLLEHKAGQYVRELIKDMGQFTKENPTIGDREIFFKFIDEIREIDRDDLQVLTDELFRVLATKHRKLRFC